MNNFLIVGNLTKDPVLRKTDNDVSVCSFDVAVNRDYENSNGERDVDFFKVVVWRNKADTCAEFLKKGSKVCVVGSLYTSSYVGEDEVKRTSYELVASSVEFLSSKKSETSKRPAGADRFDKSEVSPSEVIPSDVTLSEGLPF